MIYITILYKNNKINHCVIMPHKDKSGYSYVNLTKGHICPCKFVSIEEAIKDLKKYKNIQEYSIKFVDKIL